MTQNSSDKFIYFTVNLLKDSAALEALRQDALKHRMIDQLGQLIASRLTEYYEMMNKGIVQPVARVPAIALPVEAENSPAREAAPQAVPTPPRSTPPAAPASPAIFTPASIPIPYLELEQRHAIHSRCPPTAPSLHKIRLPVECVLSNRGAKTLSQLRLTRNTMPMKPPTTGAPSKLTGGVHRQPKAADAHQTPIGSGFSNRWAPGFIRRQNRSIPSWITLTSTKG